MRIWHEDLLHRLCWKHLNAVWREALGCFNILIFKRKGYSHHQQVKQYEFDILGLLWMLCRIRQERLRRGYKAKEIFDSEEKWEAYWKLRTDQAGWGFEQPWQTLEQQIEILKNKNCGCKV